MFFNSKLSRSEIINSYITVYWFCFGEKLFYINWFVSDLVLEKYAILYQWFYIVNALTAVISDKKTTFTQDQFFTYLRMLNYHYGDSYFIDIRCGEYRSHLWCFQYNQCKKVHVSSDDETVSDLPRRYPQIYFQEFSILTLFVLDL